MKIILMGIKFLGYVLSTLIFTFILFGFLQRLRETFSLILKFSRQKSEEKRKLKRLLLIKAGFFLPWETLTFVLTIIFALFVFHWFTSSIFILALTSFLFKQIVSEIPYLVITAFYSLTRKLPTLEEDKFVKETGTIPSDFPSCIYIPQKAKSIEDVYAAIGQGLRALRNNSTSKNNLIFIYHSDTEDDSLIQEEIRLILEARKEFGSRVFLSCRNKEAVNPFFLKKPGGYMSDYQILTQGIWHPLTYVGETFDSRRQKILLPNGKIKNHYPFYPVRSHPDKSQGSPPITGASNGVYLDDSPVCSYQTFIQYRRNLFVKERMVLKRLGEAKEFFPDIKIISKEYLVNKENPAEYYLVSQGAIFNSEVKLLFKANQWKINVGGEIELIEAKNRFFEGKRLSFIFVQIVELDEKQRLILDKVANLIDIENGKIWAKREDYHVEREYDLYKLKNKKFSLVKEHFSIEKKFFYGEDYRRSVFDRMNSIHPESMQDLIKEKIISPNEAKEFEQTGIAGDLYGLHIGKNGCEKEFFVEDSLAQFKERLTGGYLVKQSDGFGLDIKGNLIYKNIIIEPKHNLKNIFLQKEKDNISLMLMEEGEKYFLRRTDTNQRIQARERETYFYVQNPWINKIKPALAGFVVNEKDGFHLDKEGNLWYLGDIFQKSNSPILVAYKDKVKKLGKERISIDYRDNASLKRSSLIAGAGSWYKDGEGNLRRRKKVASLDHVYFNERLEAMATGPLNTEKETFPLGSYTLGENFLCQRFSEDDEIIRDENLIVKDGDLVKEEIMAQDGEYRFTPAGEVILKNHEIFPYGTYLKFPNGEVLKDELGNFSFADCGIKIINQTDADAEFLPQTVPYINSQLIRNLQEDDPYLMYQPEIGFGNQGQSTFARLNSWAQQMYRFTGRALFHILGESSAYGKMTKIVDAYVKNILFKEAIPPLARTHDHWEAMHLKTALVLSHPNLKAKNLIENTPPNFFAFLKRQEGWIGGDLALLEYESYFGVILDYLRAGLSVLKFDFSEVKFWFNYSQQRIKYLKEKFPTSSYFAKILRIWMIKRLTFYPFYYGLWLVLVGSLSLIIPGTLTVKSPSLAWLLFWLTLAILLGLPKIIIPILERFFFSERKKGKYSLLLFTLLVAVIINYAGKTVFPIQWRYINTVILLSYLAYQIFFANLSRSLSLFYQNLLRKLVSLLILGMVLIIGWFYLPLLFDWLENIPSANWLFLFAYELLPNLSGFLVPWILILGTFPTGRTTLGLLRKGIIETIYSSSILLLNVVCVPLAVLQKIIFMVFHPFRSSPWITAPFIEKLLYHKISLEEYYARLIWAPLFSSLFVIFPVILGIADVSLIFYGWPVFIWSWLLGPYLAWLSGNSGQSASFSSLEFLSLKDKLNFWKKELIIKDISPSRDKIIEKILESNLRLKNSLTQREVLRLYLCFLTDFFLNNLSLKEAIQKYLKKELRPERLREYDWQSLNEISRARIILRLAKNKTYRVHLQSEGVDLHLIKVCLSFINHMGPSRLGLGEWERLSLNKRVRILQRILKKYKLSPNSQLELKKLLQLFSHKELKSLWEKTKTTNDFSSLIESIPSEFIYLKKAIGELKVIPDLEKLSQYQRKLLLDLTASRYGLKEKIYLKILGLIPELIQTK